MKIKALIQSTALLAGLLALTPSVHSQESNRTDIGWSLGVGGVTSLSGYRGVDTQNTAFPFISYEGERFFFRGPSFGYRLTPDQPVRLAAFVSAAPAEFDPYDSDDAQMRQLDRRNFTALAGLSANYDLPAGSLTARVGTEITGRYQGQYAEVSYSYPVIFKAVGISITPAIGVEWHSSDFNNYYFGISNEEAARTDFTEYSPSSSTNPFIGATLTWRFSRTGSVFISSRYKHFDDEISDSPMIEDDSELSSLIGVTWHF